MRHPEIPLGFGGRTVAALVASMAAAATAAVVVDAPWLAPVAAAGVGLGLGGGLVWGRLRLRREVSRRLTSWDGAVEDVRLADRGLVPRWEVRLDGGEQVALVGTAFGPRNPLFLEDEDGLRRI